MAERMKFLVVDDEESICSLIEEFFRMYCQRKRMAAPLVFMAENAETGMEIIRKHQITLLISDVIMPGECGDSFVRKVHKQSPATFSILMSGYLEHASLGDLPIVCFLAKPFTFEVFKEALDKAFEKIISE